MKWKNIKKRWDLIVIKTTNKVIYSGIWFTISNFLMKTVGFITTPVFTRLLSKSEFGEFNNLQTWLILLTYITSLNLEGSLIRAVHEFKEDIDEYVSSMMMLGIISTSIWWLTFNLFYDFFNKVLYINRLYINCMFLYLICCPGVNLFQNLERYKYKYKWTVAINLTISIGASLLSVLFVCFGANKLSGRIIGYIMPTIIVGIMIYLYYFIKIKKIRFSYWKYVLPIILPYIPHLLSMSLLSNIDRVMIRKICGTEAVALYSLAYICGMIITMLVSSINSAFAPWLAEKLKIADYEIIRKVSFPYVAIFSYFAIGCVLVSPEILFLLGGYEYAEAIYVIPPVSAGCLMQFIYCMYVNVEQYSKKTMGMAFASIIAASVNYILNLIFIPQYGYIAAAYTTFMGYFVLLILHIFLVYKIGLIKIYDNKKICISVIAAVISIFSVSFIIKYYIIRYFILIGFILVGFYIIYREKEKLVIFRKSER